MCIVNIFHKFGYLNILRIVSNLVKPLVIKYQHRKLKQSLSSATRNWCYKINGNVPDYRNRASSVTHWHTHPKSIV